MDRSVIEDRELRDNKVYGRIAGVWPNQDRFTQCVVRLVILVIVTTSNATQIAKVVVFFSFDILTDQLPFLGLALGLLLKQYNYILNGGKLEKLLNGIVTDWLIDRPEEELEILRECSRRAMLFTFSYKVTAFACLIAFFIPPTVPPILDIIAPLNTSRPRVLLYPAYYFVDEQRYYFPIMVHMVLSAIILVLVIIACDINLVHVVQHACALFVITGHRFKHAADDLEYCEEKGRHAMTDQSYAKVRHSIDAHKKAIEYAELVESCHVHCFLITIAMVTMLFTVTFVKLASMEKGLMYLTYCTFTAGQLIHLFFLTIMGQFVIDSNEEIYQNICEADWYNSSTRTQSLYVLVLRKCLNPSKLTGGGFVAMNLDSFVTILKASVSYYTVLKSA